MDSRLIKSAGIAAAAIAAVNKVFDAIPLLLSYMGFQDYGYYTFYQTYMLAGFILPILYFFLLGLLPVYLYRKSKGRLDFSDCFIAAILAVVLYSILITVLNILFSLINYIFYAHGMFETQWIMLASALISPLMQASISFFGMIPALIGALTGYAILASKEEKKKWKINPWIIIAAITFICIAAVILLVILWQLGPDPSPRSPNRCTGFTHIACFDSSVALLAEKDTLNATFMNGAMATVTLTDISVAGDCLEGTGRFSETKLVAGEDTVFTCTSTDKDEGDYFTVEVDITYTEEVTGITIERTDTGRITGTVE